MAEVLSPPQPTSSPSPIPQSPSAGANPTSSSSLPHRTRPSPLRRSRASPSSSRSSRSSRPPSTFPNLQSALPYTLVRDFAYPPFHPQHYGTAPTPSPTQSDFSSSRRVSDPNSGQSHTWEVENTWSAGPWAGDGGAFYHPSWRESLGQQRGHGYGHGQGEGGQGGGAQQLPSTSFSFDSSDEEHNEGDELAQRRERASHRKSKSYAHLEDYGRGRRRDSKGKRRSSKPSQHQVPGLDSDGFFQGGPVEEAAEERSASRQGPNGAEAGKRDRDRDRDSRFANTLPSRSYHHSQTTSSPDNFLDEEHGTSRSRLPFREDSQDPPGLSPEDHRPGSTSLDESFAGPSLALYTFVPENANELALREGQIIQVGYRHGQGWLVAMDLDTGEQGLVPEEYVRLLSDIEGWGEDDTGELELDQSQGQMETETETEELSDSQMGSQREEKMHEEGKEVGA